MELADFDVSDFEEKNDNKGVYARFFLDARKDEAASIAAGRPVFADKEFIEIITSGGSNNIVCRPASDMDRQRFRAAYSKFKQGDTEQVVGTPLGEITWITKSMVEELKHMKVRTVEGLAELNDNYCSNTPGLYELKRKAQAWIAKAEGAKPFLAMSKEIEDLRAELAALKAQAGKV